MASVAVQRGLEDRLSVSSYTDPNSSSNGSPRPKPCTPYLDSSKTSMTKYGHNPNYMSQYKTSPCPLSSSPDYTQSSTPDYTRGPNQDCSETSTKDTDDDDSAAESYKSLSSVNMPLTGNRGNLPGYVSAQERNPEPPVIPSKPVMIAKENMTYNTPSRSDNPDGNPVYKCTTENIERDRSCCPLFPKGRKKRRDRGRYPTPDMTQQPQTPKPVRCKKIWGCTKRQWLLLFVLLSGTLTSSFAVCLFPPFFPKIAQQKGATATIFGIIIGTNCLTAFIFTPVVGKNLQSIGVKFAFTAGLFCSGGCCILSGFLEWFPGGALFVVMAILIRMVHAIANAGISTSTFAYIAAEFPESVAKIFAFTRATMNVAQMLGPVVGGALYAFGGFKMPFLVMGTIQAAMTLVAVGYLADFKDANSKKNDQKPQIKMFRLFLIPGIWVSFLTFIFSTMSNGFLSVTLEPLVLRKFSLSPLYVGMLFGLKDGANSVASPFWGWACDRYHRVKLFILMSSCLAFVSFVLIGPLPWLPLESTLALVIVALTLNGFGIGGQQVAGVVDAMREAVGSGFPDDAGTHGCVAGLWASLSGAGRFTSRAASGILVDHIGFRNSSVIVVALHGCIIVITLIHLMLCKEKSYVRFHDIEGAPGLANADVIDGGNRVGTVFSTTPSEHVTAKSVNVDARSYREDLEDSICFGKSPIPTPT
ncbi:hypothetical protein SK128_012500, partial [Halocaridina rubra]